MNKTQFRIFLISEGVEPEMNQVEAKEAMEKRIYKSGKRRTEKND